MLTVTLGRVNSLYMHEREHLNGPIIVVPTSDIEGHRLFMPSTGTLYLDVVGLVLVMQPL